MKRFVVRSYMTAHPHTVGVDQTLATAMNLMQVHKIRHLPVLAGGRLVGILTERDAQLVGGMRGVDAEELRVAEAMTPDPYAVAPDTSLEWVALEMAEHKFGAAVVVERGRVIGVLTTVDALRALQDALARARRRHPTHPPAPLR